MPPSCQTYLSISSVLEAVFSRLGPITTLYWATQTTQTRLNFICTKRRNSFTATFTTLMHNKLTQPYLAAHSHIIQRSTPLVLELLSHTSHIFLHGVVYRCVQCYMYLSVLLYDSVWSTVCFQFLSLSSGTPREDFRLEHKVNTKHVAHDTSQINCCLMRNEKIRNYK